jgi:hypothetical protein
VLLLLTKVDVLASATARQRAVAGQPVSAADVARAIDPLGLAIEVVGARTLLRLCRSIRADAEFAVGVCSASGFCDRGAPFSRWSPGRTADERLRAWAPFGVSEVLQYIALGRCGRTVDRVTEAEILGSQKIAIDGYAFEEVQ